MPPVDVLCCGLVTLDLVQEVDAFPAPDHKITARSARLDIGGPATNAARTAAGLGSRVGLVTMTGSGPVADVIRARLTQTAVALLDATPAGADWSAPVSAVMVDPSGRRVVVSANATGSPEPSLDLSSLPTPGVALVDGHHLALAELVARPARRHGALVVLDGGSWKPGLEWLLPDVDVVIAAAGFAAPPEFADVIDSRPMVAVSHGPDPISVRIGDRRATVAVPRVRAVDTLGAGDVLHGAFAHELAAQGAPGIDPDVVLAALARAAEIAADSCTQRGLPWP